MIELNNPMSKQAALDSWVFIHQRQFGGLSVPVMLNLSDKQLEKHILERFSEYSAIRKVTENPQLIVQTFKGENGKDSIQLSTTHARTLYENEIKKGNHSRVSWWLTQSILAYVQSNFLRSFDMKNDLINTHLEIIPMDEESFAKKSFPHFKEGEKFKLRISNKGTIPIYFTVIDIQPDNIVNIIVPSKGSGHTSRELYLEPGQHMDYQSTFEIMPPYGTEVLKLIATLSPIDLSPIASTRGEEIPDDAHPFEKLFSATYLNDSRGQTQFSLGTMMHVDSKIFEIQKK